MSNWKTPYLHECPYPFLFSEETLQCENYTEVVCGTRYEPKWECKKTLIFTNTELRVIFTAVNSYEFIDKLTIIHLYEFEFALKLISTRSINLYTILNKYSIELVYGK